MKLTMWLAALTALSLGTLASTASGQEAGKGARLITVTGEAEVRVVPTEVALRLAVETKAKTLASAKADHDGRMKQIQALLHNAGIDPKDIQTSNLTMGPEFEEIKGKSVLVGYEMSQSLSVLLRDLSKYESVMTGLLEAGVNRLEGVEFRTGEMRRYRDEARVLAIRAAKEKATLMAGELNQKLGRPYSITEEATPQYFRPNVNVQVSVAAPESAGGDLTIAGGQLIVRATITVQFELKD